MIWMQRLVASVFAVGLTALFLSVGFLVRQSEEPSLPILVGLVGAAALILLSGGCIALISIAISTRKGSEALARLANRGSVPIPVTTPETASRKTQPEPEQSATPPRPQGKPLVAER